MKRVTKSTWSNTSVTTTDTQHLLFSLNQFMDIRPFSTSDEPHLVALWQACGLVVPWNDPHLDIARKLQVQPELFLVGLLDNQIVATVMGGYDGHRGWLNYLAVHPDYQRQGLGKMIITAIETKLEALGCPKINLQVRNTNLLAVEFYQALGYQVDECISLGKRLIPDTPHSQ